MLKQKTTSYLLYNLKIKPALTCSKSTMETPERVWNMFTVSNNDKGTLISNWNDISVVSRSESKRSPR